MHFFSCKILQFLVINTLESWIHIEIYADSQHWVGRVSDPDPYSESGFRSKWKMIHKSRKKLGNFLFWSAGCFFWELKASFVTWTSFVEANWKVNSSFKKKFFTCNFFSNFGHQNPGSGLDPDWIRIWMGSGSVFGLKFWIRIHIKWIRIQNPAGLEKTRFFF